MKNNKTKQKGIVSIHITMMIMIVSLAIVLGLTTIFVGYLRIMRGMGDSVVAHYAANTGIERLLYEEKRCWTSPCPAHCASECTGLTTTTAFSSDPPLAGGATFRAEFTERGFESFGTFREARRAIRVRHE